MPGNLCQHCAGLCCRYIALPIDTPEDRQDFDDIRWYLLHENISVFVEDGDWYLSVAADCRQLGPDFRCTAYQTRPRICREYTTSDCDYHSGDYGWEHHFTCPEHLDEYMREFFGNKRKRRSGARRKTGRARVKATLRARRKRRPDYSNARCDLRGVPLPVLGVDR
jgi:Fe-S-cluster containining protein